MFENRTLDRLDQMLDAALSGTFQESDYNETKLSRLETKWKRFLSASVLSKENIMREKENVKSLVSDISHQTKTPMTNIRMYGSLLKELLQSEKNMEQQNESLQLLNELLRQTQKLDFLMQALTKMSRLESNIVAVKPQKQKIITLISEVVSDMEKKAERKKIKIENKYRGTGNACYDFKWTKEALENIVDNAIKYSPDNSSVVISVEEYEMYLMIQVKDEGMGIKEEDIPKIFGRFYRSWEVHQEEGVGIGLYLAREILKKEKGYIKVKSKWGEGSAFLLYLPRD